MITDLKPYPAMRDSGVPWLGEVPEHWKVLPLGRLGQLFKGKGGSKADEVESGIPCIRYGDLYTRHEFFITQAKACIAPERPGSYTPIEKGDLLFAASGETHEDIGRSAVNLLDGDARCGGDIIVFRPSVAFDPRFLGYAADSQPSRDQKATMGRGFTVVHIYSAQLKHLALSVPPLPEQAAIVRFLDHADRRIRRYIRAKQTLIKLLEEQKQAIIHRAVTRGLDPDVRLKPSGVEWLGDVPEHWEVKRLKWVTRLQRGYDLPADKRTPGPFPVVSSGGIIDTHSEFRSTAPGVVLGRYGSTDAVFFVESDFWPHNTALFVTNFQGNRPRWCYFMLRTISKAGHSGKSAVPGVDRKDLFEIRVAVPPVEEQVAIAHGITSATAEVNEAIAVASREIALLHEYRIRLTADVVTGKLDVREVASRLPDEADHHEPLDESSRLDEGDEPTTDEAELEEVEA